jgi:hypothetical protein
MTVAVEALTFDTIIVLGRQFISPNFLMPWAPNLGVVKKTTTSGLEDHRSKHHYGHGEFCNRN